MMYIWNGFPVVSKREDLSENLLLTVEKAEATLQNQSKYEPWKPENPYHSLSPVMSLLTSACARPCASRGPKSLGCRRLVTAVQVKGGRIRAAHMDEPWAHSAKCKKPVAKDCMLHDSIYMKYWQ